MYIYRGLIWLRSEVANLYMHIQINYYGYQYIHIVYISACVLYAFKVGIYA